MSSEGKVRRLRVSTEDLDFDLVVAAQVGDVALCAALLAEGACLGVEVPDVLVLPGMDLQSGSALHAAALSGNTSVARMLCEKGAPVDACCSGVGEGLRCSVTPLYMAIVRGDIAMTATLIHAGADCNIRTPGECAQTMISIAVSLEKEDICRFLLDKGADVDATNDCSDCCGGGGGALHIAVQKQNIALTRMILRAGAEANSVPLDRMTALGRALHGGNLEIVSLLLNNGADPNLSFEIPSACDAHWHKVCPLYLAAVHEDEPAVELLLSHGARLVKDDDSILFDDWVVDFVADMVLQAVLEEVHIDSDSDASPTKPPGVRNPCGHCGAANARDKCSGCKKQRYCSTRCQRKAWKGGHRNECTGKRK